MLQGLAILYLVSFVLGIFIVVRVWRASTLDGVLTLFIPFYVLYALYKYWNDPDHDIRWPLFAQIIVSCALVWNVYHAAPAILDANRAAAVQEQASSDDDDQGDDIATSQQPAAVSSTSGKTTYVATATQAPPSAEAEAPRRATPAELQKLAESVIFQRGRFVREAIGMHFDIPLGQHLLTGADARRADTALRGENDTHLIGWMVPANKTVTDPDLHIVRMRWRHDGLVDANSASLEPAALLDAARTRPHVARLSGSGGALLDYEAAPMRDGSSFVWSEERKPDDMTASVFDCHALRLARKGVLELSIVGADAKAAKSCADELRALLAAVHFEPSEDYPAQIQGERVAVYSLAGLITQTQ